MSKAELYENVWGLPYSDNANALFTAVSRLNKKLDDNKADVTSPAKQVKATHLKAYRLNKNRFMLVSHPHYHSRFPYGNRLYALICFHICTIPLAFRRGGARSSRCTDPLHFYNHCKRTIIPRSAPRPCLPCQR